MRPCSLCHLERWWLTKCVCVCARKKTKKNKSQKPKVVLVSETKLLLAGRARKAHTAVLRPLCVILSGEPCRQSCFWQKGRSQLYLVWKSGLHRSQASLKATCSPASAALCQLEDLPLLLLHGMQDWTRPEDLQASEHLLHGRAAVLQAQVSKPERGCSSNTVSALGVCTPTTAAAWRISGLAGSMEHW